MSGVVGTGRPAIRKDLPAEGARVHLMGIGGAGMRGLAVLLDASGYRVSGCDRSRGADLEELADRRIEVMGGHDASHVASVDAVVRSSAVPGDHPEVRAAEARGIAVLKRARALGALVNGRALVGVSGTHGKTTITAMTGTAAIAAALDPLVMVGGRVGSWAGYARPGKGPAIVEADEYDRSFLELDPTVAVVSSLEPEHLDTYGGFDAVRDAFSAFARRAVGRDGVIYCRDDPGARELASGLEGAWSYGFDEASRCRIESDGPGRCRFLWPGGRVDVSLAVAGRHNQQNAAAAFLAGLRLGGEPAALVEGLESFTGVGRRLETLGRWDGVTLVDDYAHHPTEVAASLAALRAAFPGARVEVVFQPHLYSRTRDFARAFASALAEADAAWVLPVYPAREAPIAGVTSESITSAGPDHIRSIDRDAAIERALEGGDRVVVFMGAGDVTGLAHAAAERLAGDAVGA